MPPKQPLNDRNFTGLTRRFKRNIYDSPKGKLRLAVLTRDFAAANLLSVEQPNYSRVLDVGAGQGQFSLQLAKQGHHVKLTDISKEMLEEANQAAKSHSLKSTPEFQVIDLWQLADHKNAYEAYDIVICHAVLEWLQDPLDAINKLLGMVKKGGYISLLFYNVHGLVFKNLLRSNYKKVLAKDVRGQKGSLTPINPQDPTDIIDHLKASSMKIICYSGVRVFHDYIFDAQDRMRDLEQVEALELKFSKLEPYRGLGRYVHVLAQKN